MYVLWYDIPWRGILRQIGPIVGKRTVQGCMCRKGNVDKTNASEEHHHESMTLVNSKNM
jgi:hypothetical protein